MQTMAVKNANRCFCRVKRVGYFHIICIDIGYIYSLFPYHSSTTPLQLTPLQLLYNSLLLYLFCAISIPCSSLAYPLLKFFHLPLSPHDLRVG